MERYYQPEIECASREQILAWQNERLLKQVKNVWDNVPYYRQKMQAKGLTPDDIKSIDDLEGKKIGTQMGTTGYIYCSDTPENGGYGEENVIAYDSGITAVQALVNGQVDCVVIDNEPAQAYVKANAGLSILDTEFTNEDYAIGMNKGNACLLAAVNAAMAELKADGTFQKIVEKYIPAE